MYAIGTSAIRYIANQLGTSVPADFVNRIVGYVGTLTEMNNSTPSERSLFIVQNSSLEDGQVYFGDNTPSWNDTGSTIPLAYINKYIIPASGWPDVVIQVARATQEQVDNPSSNGFPVYDGFPVYVSSPAPGGGGALYIGDKAYGKNQYVLVASMAAQTVPIGAILYWPAVMPYVPDGYLRADGSRIPIADNMDLWTLAYQRQDLFKEPGDLADGNFRLPKHDEAIVRVK